MGQALFVLVQQRFQQHAGERDVEVLVEQGAVQGAWCQLQIDRVGGRRRRQRLVGHWQQARAGDAVGAGGMDGQGRQRRAGCGQQRRQGGYQRGLDAEHLVGDAGALETGHRCRRLLGPGLDQAAADQQPPGRGIALVGERVVGETTIEIAAEAAFRSDHADRFAGRRRFRETGAVIAQEMAVGLAHDRGGLALGVDEGGDAPALGQRQAAHRAEQLADLAESLDVPEQFAPAAHGLAASQRRIAASQRSRGLSSASVSSAAPSRRRRSIAWRSSPSSPSSKPSLQLIIHASWSAG